MQNMLIDLLKEKPLYVPSILVKNYKLLGITAEELLIIMIIMKFGDNVIYDPVEFANQLGWDKHEVMKVVNNLFDKHILNLVIDKSNHKACEYISLELLYDKLYNIIIGDEKEVSIDNSIFSLFEGELGRTLSPMEYEKIKEWITSGNSTELIACALNEAVLKGVSNLNYIDSILMSWNKKGYKSKKDVLKEKENYRTKKEKIEVFDTDWLNSNE